jgi:hypothetical protein
LNPFGDFYWTAAFTGQVRMNCSLFFNPNHMSLSEQPATEAHEQRAQKCHALNDQFRQTFLGGTIVSTQGVQALNDTALDQLIPAIQIFDNFNANNDPYGEHDFGEVTITGIRVWFKIDAYDIDLKYGSPDPTDPAVTKRVMTIMLPEEY